MISQSGLAYVSVSIRFYNWAARLSILDHLLAPVKVQFSKAAELDLQSLHLSMACIDNSFRMF